MKNIRIMNARTIMMLSVGIMTFTSCVPAKQALPDPAGLPSEFDVARTSSSSAASLPWNDYYQDANLRGLIEEALTNNQELKIGAQNVNAAGYLIQARTGEFLPFVKVAGAVDQEKVGLYTRNGSVEHQLTIAGEEFPEPLNNYFGALQVSWELDLWKKLRNERNAARNEFFASQEGQHLLQTSIVAEVAQLYYELIALDAQIGLIEQNIGLQENALKIVKLQKIAGETTELAVKRFEAELAKNKGAIFQVRQQVAISEREMNFLLGRASGTIVRDQSGLETMLDRPTGSGTPTDLIVNRPDVKRAEYELEAAKLDVKAARAAFLPNVGLGGQIGLNAFDPKYLVHTAESMTYALAGDLVGPLVNRKAIRAQFHTASARQIQALVEYEKTLILAYLEVGNQLSAEGNLSQSYTYQKEQVAAVITAVEISNTLFQNARADYMEVLLTQREALEAKTELVETQLSLVQTKVGLYKSLGGGWR
jgi:NodT family efflux transporter outer membrane factor (OMF) lipoprotein